MSANNVNAGIQSANAILKLKIFVGSWLGHQDAESLSVLSVMILLFWHLGKWTGEYFKMCALQLAVVSANSLPLHMFFLILLNEIRFTFHWCAHVCRSLDY